MYRFTFGNRIDSFAVHDIESGRQVFVERVVPAIRGPLMVTLRGATRNIYDWVYEGIKLDTLPPGHHAVPRNRDYRSLDFTELEVVDAQTLDTEYRQRHRGRPHVIPLEKVWEIVRQLDEGKVMKSIALDHGTSASFVCQLAKGETYWYARG